MSCVLSLQQAESQVTRPIKTEFKQKGERPALHLHIPPPSGTISTPSQPSSAESPFPYSQDPSTSFFPSTGPPASEGMLRTPGSVSGMEVQGDPFTKMPPQSPHHHYSNPSTPFSQSSSPMHASSGFQMPPGIPQGRPPSLGTLDLQPGTPGTPRRPQPMANDPFLRPQQQQAGGALQEPLAPPESPRLRQGPAAGECFSKPGESPLLSQPPTHFGDLFRVRMEQRQECGMTSSSPASTPGLGQRQDFMGLPSPAPTASMGPRPDFGIGSPASAAVSGFPDGSGHSDVFKAPMTPRMHQGEQVNPLQGYSTPQHPGASPQHHTDQYRQSPSTPFSDPYAQPPLTPRPQSGDSCSPLPQRGLPLDTCSRVPASPQSQGSCQSPLTPGALSNDAYSCQSPVTPRFQSPDPYSRPPSRPQSRDPFAPMHKPPRSTAGEPSYRTSPHVSQPGTPMGDSLPKGPSAQPSFARSPSVGLFPSPQHQTRAVPATYAEAAVHSPSHQPGAPQHAPAMNVNMNSFALRSPDPSFQPQRASLVRMPERREEAPSPQELPDLSLSQDPSLSGLSQLELEKHRQVNQNTEYTFHSVC